MDLLKVYEKLLKEFGRQGWWPTAGKFRPREWEICVGAILTQNTNWRNVEKALESMKKEGILSPKDVISIEIEKLEEIIRPSRFYKQKAGRLKGLAEFVLDFGGFKDFRNKVGREELLGVKGIGLETCDSILLYACDRPYFVIDSYTKRFVRTLGIKVREDYESLREFFENNLPKDAGIYKEFHALIVEWGKRDR
jgi:endonuclease-3 related protein